MLQIRGRMWEPLNEAKEQVYMSTYSKKYWLTIKIKYSRWNWEEKISQEKQSKTQQRFFLIFMEEEVEGNKLQNTFIIHCSFHG